MEPLVFGLVAIAAVLHVAWNVLVKTSGEPRAISTAAMAAGSVAIVPIGAAAWIANGRPPIPADAIALGIVSGLLEAVYFVLLSAAYRRGDLSVVYPIARGTAPLLAVVVGVAILGERLSPLGAAGVALLLAGIVALQRPWRHLSATRDAGALFALLTGLAIAGYSAVDRVGVRLASPWVYAAILWPVSVAGLAAWAIVRHEPVFPGPAERRQGILVGLLTLVAYGLILVAYTLAPLAVVAPLRESAIVLASGWGVLRLSEAGRSEARRRLAAACLVVAGAVLIAL